MRLHNISYTSTKTLHGAQQREQVANLGDGTKKKVIHGTMRRMLRKKPQKLRWWNKKVKLSNLWKKTNWNDE